MLGMTANSLKVTLPGAAVREGCTCNPSMNCPYLKRNAFSFLQTLDNFEKVPFWQLLFFGQVAAP